MTKRRSGADEEFYHPSDEEWAGIQEGLAQAERGEFVPDEEMKAFRKRHERRR